MITDTIVSMTDLRTKTKSVMMKVKKYGSAIVVSNNKPLFVITFPSTWDEGKIAVDAIVEKITKKDPLLVASRSAKRSKKTFTSGKEVLDDILNS